MKVVGTKNPSRRTGRPRPGCTVIRLIAILGEQRMSLTSFGRKSGQPRGWPLYPRDENSSWNPGGAGGDGRPPPQKLIRIYNTTREGHIRFPEAARYKLRRRNSGRPGKHRVEVENIVAYSTELPGASP